MADVPHSPPSNKPRTRWGSFSLRTLLILITVAAVVFTYVGYQRSVIQARRALIHELRASGIHVITLKDASHGMRPLAPATERYPSVPLVRGWLGDEPIDSIGFYPHAAPGVEIMARVKELFPEARIEKYEPPLVPCHPGCFPHGTLVETPAGPRPIEAIAAGDEVYSISDAGKRISLPVMSIFRTTNRLWLVNTNQGTLRTTETQPLCTHLERFVEVGKVQPGDVLLGWSAGETVSDAPDGTVHEVRVTGIEKTNEIVPVINLVLGQREPFIAGGFLARSKPPRADDSPVEQLIQSSNSKHHEHHP